MIFLKKQIVGLCLILGLTHKIMTINQVAIDPIYMFREPESLYEKAKVDLNEIMQSLQSMRHAAVDQDRVQALKSEAYAIVDNCSMRSNDIVEALQSMINKINALVAELEHN